MSILLFAVIFCLAPAGVIWLCRRFTLLDNIGTDNIGERKRGRNAS